MNWGRLKEMLRFALNGGICFVVDYGVMVLLKECFHVHYLWATAGGFIVSVVLNYLICIKWVFQQETAKTRRSQVLFLLTSVVGLGLNQLFMWVQVDLLAISYLIAKVVSTGLVMVWNYVTKRKSLNVKGS